MIIITSSFIWLKDVLLYRFSDRNHEFLKWRYFSLETKNLFKMQPDKSKREPEIIRISASCRDQVIQESRLVEVNDYKIWSSYVGSPETESVFCRQKCTYFFKTFHHCFHIPIQISFTSHISMLYPHNFLYISCHISFSYIPDHCSAVVWFNELLKIEINPKISVVLRPYYFWNLTVVPSSRCG